MNKEPEQKPAKFYKYMSADNAVNSLKNEKLRWSSPLLFNDPFDVPRTFASGIRLTDIFNAKHEIYKEYISDPKTNLNDLNAVEGRIVYLAKKTRGKCRKIILESLKKINMIHVNSIDQSGEDNFKEIAQLWESYIPRVRILCLSAEKNIAPMWHYYADLYQGIVLEFDTAMDSSQLWPNIHQVKYPDERPPLFGEKDLARLLFFNQKKAMEYLTSMVFYVKKSDWSYEKEYRIFRLAEPNDTKHYSDYPLPKSSISSIYFGPEIKSCNKKCLMQLIKKKLPHVQMYDMSFKFGWEMKFDPIDI